MKAASPEDPAVSELAQAGPGNQCLITEMSQGGELTPSWHDAARPAPALFQPAAPCLQTPNQKGGCCLSHWQ